MMCREDSGSFDGCEAQSGYGRPQLQYLLKAWISTAGVQAGFCCVFIFSFFGYLIIAYVA
jgi:hypothetical protein